MLRELRQVLRLIKLKGKQRQQSGLKTAGGLLVLLWTEEGSSSQRLNCTVASAGPWCVGLEMRALQPDLKKVLFPGVWSCPEPDPEELSAFTDLYGSLQFLWTFQIKDAGLSWSTCQAHIRAFLQTFSLTNAGIRIHLKSKIHAQKSQHEFRVLLRRKVTLAVQPPLMLDLTCSAQSVALVHYSVLFCFMTHIRWLSLNSVKRSVEGTASRAGGGEVTAVYEQGFSLLHSAPRCGQTGSWCQGGHPVVGERLPLSIPPAAMDQGLLGELSVQLVTLLSPCVLQYPNLPTELSRMQISFFLGGGCDKLISSLTISFRDLPYLRSVSPPFKPNVLVYSPSNIPVPAPSGFLRTLPAALDYPQLGLGRIHCPSSKASHDDLVPSGGVVYAVEQENWDDPEQESSRLPVQQSLLVFLFLQHSDPFTSELTDIMVGESLLERHLEDILSNNRRAVTSALQAELFNTTKASKQRKKKQEKLQAAAEVILSSTISIVSSSSSMDFRHACLTRMKVHDTHELSASLRESLWRVTSWKFVPKVRCYPAQVEDQAEGYEHARAEI
ncbi:LOW QUALITY PROTEIN: type 2 DNA topoisomerase 6 subunit B-like [Fundulus diaphanus]